MKTTWIIVIALCTFLLGFSLGVGIGMQKGQYMLFEGLNIALDGAEINTEINLNETKLVDEFNRTIIQELKPLLREGLNET